jgi:hypothetical protein
MIHCAHPVPSKGRLISVMRRGAGCGGRCGTQDVRSSAEAQAAIARSTDRGSVAEDNRRPGQGTAPPGLSQSKPHTPRAERRCFSAVRGDLLVWILSKIPHGAAGSAESPAFRAPLRFARVGMRSGLRARPRRPKNREGGALSAAIARLRGAAVAGRSNPQWTNRRVL